MDEITWAIVALTIIFSLGLFVNWLKQ